MENPSSLVKNWGYLSRKVLDNLRSLAVLKEVGNAVSDSIETLFSDPTEEKPKAMGMSTKASFLANPIDTCGNGNVYKVQFPSRVQRVVNKLTEQDAVIMANHNSVEAFLSNLGEDKPEEYTHEDLKNFTLDFSNIIGKGGSANVFKGLLSNGMEVAVKVLTENSLVREVFEAEVITVMKASHPNIIKLHGYCFSHSMKALVYEFMMHGSLDKVLYENHHNIKWQKLYGIMIEIAKVLSYLHDGCGEQIIHADVKAANVLLDSNLSPKVADFGLAKLMNRDMGHFILTKTRGTPGYAAPETWQASSVVTYKCDVYSFGIMLFEVLARRWIHNKGQWFPTQVWHKINDDCLDEIIADCGIQWDDRGRAKILSGVALWCVQYTPELRPSMSRVVKMLEEEVYVTVPPNPYYPSALLTSMQPSQVTRIDESENSEILFKYIEAAVKSGQIGEVERITRELNFYNPERTKNFLMDAKLSDVRPLVNVCDRFGFIADLTHYLYTNNKLRFIKDYVQKINPGNAPLVVGKLLDDKCPENIIKGLLSARFQLPVEPLVEECEKRNRLDLLAQFLEQLVSDGSKDVHVHNALGKIIVDSNNNPEHFLTTNPYYDSLLVGKYCEERHNPTLAVVAYRRGQCDNEFINITNINSLFKLQADYVVQRMDSDLWKKVLDPEYEYRTHLIGQVVFAIAPETTSEEQVSAAVKAFMTADLPPHLVKLLVLQKTAFSGNFNLRNLLILSAIKVDQSKVMDYIHRLDAFVDLLLVKLQTSKD